LNLNGRIFTNSNLLVTNLNGADRTRLYQVSSPDSCFYEQENSKIIVAGNVVNGWSGNNLAPQRNAVGVHLFQQFAPGASGRNAAMLGAAKTISTADEAESASDSSLEVLYNNEAYADRLSLLVAAQMGPPIAPDNLPDPETQPTDPFLVKGRPSTQTREQALREYFKQMLRKVPFAEVGLKENATGTYGLPWNSAGPTTSPLTGTQDTLRPVENSWMIPNATTNIDLREGQLETTIPTGGSPPAEEEYLGDRVVAGNNLPALRWDETVTKFVSTADPLPGKWNPDDPGNSRTRSPQVTKLADVGATERSGFWEGAAAETPQNPLAGVGGLRVITSAGVYERINSFLPPPTWIDPSTGSMLRNAATDNYDDPATTGANVEAYPVVWPDTMPMSPVLGAQRVYNNGAIDSLVSTANSWDTDALPATAADLPPAADPAWGDTIDDSTPKYAKGDLRMRATAVYHYAQGGGYDATVQPPNYDSVRPFACVSSYYDPSTPQTARNITSLPDSSGLLAAAGLPAPATVTRSATIGSNNGVVYGPPTDRTADPQATPGTDGLLGGAAPNDLQRQANYVFPDGRFANGPLREALLKAPAERKLADKAAIDSTVCALEILANPSGNGAVGGLTDGAIQEVAFLNAREIKAIDRDDPATANVNEAFTVSSPLGTAPPAAQLTGNYNQPLEEREPLEVRATQIDLDRLRSVGGITGGEYLLPNSGIIYASRDDALPDRSARIAGGGGIDQGRSATVSPTDSLLDPTRKPNGILLVNGTQLARNPGSSATVADVVREKGLTLASNLPVYIQGDFNLHTKQEFEGTFSWDTFYDRDNLDENFACRPNDPRLNGKCTTGDDWRPANVLADAVTLLSEDYRFGFRNEGDFDLRNNAGAAAVLPRRQQGFFTNNFVTNGLSSGAFSDNGLLVGTPGASGTALTDTPYVNPAPPILSSYFNNFVTPVQRRGPFPEYLMEVCPKLPVSACGDNDWFVNPATATKAAPGPYTSPDPADMASVFQAGSTVDPPMPALQRFPRRVAFRRTGILLETPNDPQPLGITGGNSIAAGVGEVRGNNGLWFAGNSGGVVYNATNILYPVNTSDTDAGTTDGSRVFLPILAAASTTLILPVTGLYDYKGSQPLLVPVPQLMCVTAATPGNPRCGGTGVQNTGWVPRAVNTTFNLIVAAGDTPSRALNAAWGDFNGGLQNLPRFLEIWSNDTATFATNIVGSFIQQNRSAFSTAPYLPILPPPPANNFPPNPDDRLSSLFALLPIPPTGIEPLTTYNIAGERIPYFTPPTRNWGFDVGLLSQPPDLFTQKFTTPPSRPSPDEYFREVPRNDEWVTTLMCSKLAANNQNATSSRPTNCPL